MRTQAWSEGRRSSDGSTRAGTSDITGRSRGDSENGDSSNATSSSASGGVVAMAALETLNDTQKAQLDSIMRQSDYQVLDKLR